MGMEKAPQENGKKAARIEAIRKRIENGFYDTSIFKEQLADILMENDVIFKDSDISVDDENIRKSLALDLFDDFEEK